MSDPQDENQIRELIEHWATAVRDEDLAGIRADHDPNLLMFDVPPPFLTRGLDAYMETWQIFYANIAKPVVFNFDDVKVTAGFDVAFATATGRCVYINRQGQQEPLDFRLTMGLKKIEGKWRILHEHHSVPAT